MGSYGILKLVKIWIFLFIKVNMKIIWIECYTILMWKKMQKVYTKLSTHLED